LVLVAAVCCYLVAYRLYSAFISAKLLALDDTRATPRRLDMVAILCDQQWFCSGTTLRQSRPGPLLANTRRTIRVLPERFGDCGCAFADVYRISLFVLFDSRDGKTLAKWRATKSVSSASYSADRVLAIMVILLGGAL